MSRCTRAKLAALGLMTIGLAGGAAGSGTPAYAGQPEAGLADASAPGGVVTQDEGSGSIVIGGSGQQAGQTQATDQANSQQLDPNGGTVVGGSQQGNDQQSTTQQAIDQTESGTFVIFGGGLHQRANQTAATVQGNDQSIDGSVVLGKADQSNVQTADINQGIKQNLTGTFLVFGGTKSPDPRLTASFNAIGACAVCSDALSDSSVGLSGGDLQQTGGPNQSTAGTYVVLGNLDQSFSQTSTIAEGNDQSVQGSIIIGDVSQANVQHASVGQSIDESLSGTYIVFGTLDQSADQLALISESNNQKLQGG
jgi:hypothetical protein